MINHLSGTLFERGKDFVVVECAGIGFKVSVTTTTIDSLPPGQSEVTILTHLQMRDGGADLFGFLTEDERALFYALTGVAGVGPKSGLAVLSSLGGKGVIDGALRGDPKLFASVSGIGKKLAQRLVAELPDRLKKLDNLETGNESDRSVVSAAGLNDAIEALVSLGYQRNEAHSAVSYVCKLHPENLDPDKLVRESLAYLYGTARKTGR